MEDPSPAVATKEFVPCSLHTGICHKRALEMRQGEHRRCAEDGDSGVTPEREGCLGAAVSRVRAAPLARSPASGLLFRATPQPRRRGVAGGSEELDLD
nr:unnamed protein product [Digitaria exilis]